MTRTSITETLHIRNNKTNELKLQEEELKNKKKDKEKGLEKSKKIKKRRAKETKSNEIKCKENMRKNPNFIRLEIAR